MERTQKQITGRSPAPYSWDDGRMNAARVRRSDKNAFRIEDVNASKTKKQAEKVKLVILELATIAILVMMLSMVIGKLNHISRIKKEHIQMKETLEILDADVSVKRTRLQNLISDESIEFLAETQLNMIDPDDESVRVLAGVKKNTSGETHTAEAGFRP